MSFILRTTRFAAAAPRIATRNFSISSVRALKEGTQNTNEEGAAEHNEHHKQDQLQKQKEGKNNWKPELASQSEEAVAADRHTGKESPEELAKKTAGHAEEKHKQGNSTGFENL